MITNHKRSNKNRTDRLNPHDVRWLYIWILGWRGDYTNLHEYWKEISKIPLPAFMKKWQISSVTRVTDDGICHDCNKKRCIVCNGCAIDIFAEDLEERDCQRCICESYEPEEPLNGTGVSLDELVRHRQGCRKKKEEAL